MSYVIVVIGVMAVVFSISIVFMMAYDYHIYLVEIEEGNSVSLISSSASSIISISLYSSC